VTPRPGGSRREGKDMSLDRSLKTGGNLAAKRSVMKRSERIAKMVEDKRFDPKAGKPLGLPKTLVAKVKV
jgi:small basic protein (TIGR04137 family)